MNTQTSPLRVLALLLIALALTACADQGSAPPRIDGAPETVVSAKELMFAPTQITLPAAAANLTLRNDGQTTHNLTAQGLNIHLVAEPGQSVTTGLRDLKPGTYDAICSVPGHAEAGMRLTIVVK